MVFWAPTKYRGRKTHKNTIYIATWNVRTLLDNPNNLCPERKTAWIARELSRYNVDIAAISETHLADSGKLCEELGGYTYYWSGKPASERSASGVGFAIKNSIARSLMEPPKSINDRLMTLRLHTAKDKFLHLISVYAPTLPSSEDVKQKFYDELRNVLAKIPTTDKIILLGDFNARVGTEHEAWTDVLGRHGVGNCNTNGFALLQVCAEFNLSITNTFFRLPNKLKTSWMHPRSKHWHLLDYVIVRRSDIKDVLITRAMRGAEGWTDHRLIRSQMRLHYKPPRRAQHKISPKLAFATLSQDHELRHKLDTHFGTAFPSVDRSVSAGESWRTYADSLREVSQRVVGKPQKRNQDWFDECDAELQKLVEDSRRALKTTTNALQRRNIQQELKAKVREQKNLWWRSKSEELQNFADSNQTAKFFEGLKAIFGPKQHLTAPIYSRDKSKRLTDPDEVLARWAEHFCEVLNPSSQGADLSYINQLENLPIAPDLDNPPSFQEFHQAIKRLKNGKASGSDNLPAEVFKYGGPNIKNRLFELVLQIWETENIPQEWKDANLCKLYKGKGRMSDCGSYRGIALLSAAGKVLSHIINGRLNQLAENYLPESQCGFRPFRGTVDAIFVVKQLQEKHLEQYRDLYLCFVDLEKAFDRVPRTALWAVLEKIGCPVKFTNLIRQFHDGMLARVQHENNFTDQFPVTSGVKQGCVMAPTLFAIYFAATMNDALAKCNNPITLNVRSDKSVFNISRFKARSKVQKLPVLEILYADDVCLVADSAENLQLYLDNLDESCRKFGLVISVSKTQILKQPARGTSANETAIYLDRKQLEEVQCFRYLGNLIRSDNRLESELSARIASAAAAFGRLNRRVWDSHDLQLQTKLSVYKAIILPLLLYSSETWCLYRGDIRRLDVFHMRCLRSVLRVTWEDRVPNSEILRRANMTGMECLLMKGQLRWCGHLVRMDDSRLPKSVFYSELSNGKRRVGGQHLRYKDVLKRHLVSCDISCETWEELAQNRREWRNAVMKGTANFEHARLQDLDTKRQHRKARPKPTYDYTYNSSGQLFCYTCRRVFKTKFGFASHCRAHARN